MSNGSKYGKKIREIREKNGDTLEDLAKKLNMAFGNLGKYERGERKITPELLEQIAEIYDVKLSYFYGEEIELPQELIDAGADWAAVVNEAKERKITPEEVRAVLDLLDKVKK